MPSIIDQIRTALVDGGAAWANFKTGTRERTHSLGRYDNDLSPDELVAYWQNNGP